jgi:hypothetical protein
MYVITHKDFNNGVLINQASIILSDDKLQLKKKYKLKIMQTYKNNRLYPKKRGYSEGSEI